MSTTGKELEWLHRHTEEYRASKSKLGGVVEELENEGKLGHGFSSVDELDEVDIGDGSVRRPTFVNANLPKEQKDQVCCLLKEFISCFTWEYTEMPGLSRELVEHKLPIKPGFRPYKRTSRNFNPLLLDRIKEEVNRLLKAKFI
jgi:hypothetical protein